jgi:mannose-6-phosphate isomerase-like protein (cupin superfamily)
MSFKLLTAGELRKLAAEHEVSKLFRSDSGRFWTNLVTKDHAPNLVAEMHDNEADIYVVVEGEADLYLGGALVEPSSPQVGQHIGANLDGATCRHLAHGDVVIIPEGVPHMLDVRNSRFVYLVIKEDVAP